MELRSRSSNYLLDQVFADPQVRHGGIHEEEVRPRRGPRRLIISLRLIMIEPLLAGNGRSPRLRDHFDQVDRFTTGAQHLLNPIHWFQDMQRF